MLEELPKSYWERVWSDIKLPQVVLPDKIPDYHNLLVTFLPPGNGERTLIEVGCAPGMWMHYFSKQFGYLVTGLDYAPMACKITRRNLAMLHTEAEVRNEDLFAYPINARQFDVVFSLGLIEHFPNTDVVVARLVDLLNPDGGYIVSIIPNLYGLNRLISKTFRPGVFQGHVPITLFALISAHENSSIRTLFADYAGGYHVIPPLEKNTFSMGHPRISFLANLPVRMLNCLVRILEMKVKRFPRSIFLSPSLMYIGQKLVR